MVVMHGLGVGCTARFIETSIGDATPAMEKIRRAQLPAL